MTWFYGESLLVGSSEREFRIFDVSYSPEGDPMGKFIVNFYAFKPRDYTNTINLGQIKTRDKTEVVRLIEKFMWAEPDPSYNLKIGYTKKGKIKKL